MNRRKRWIQTYKNLLEENARLRAEIETPTWIQEIERQFCEWKPITSFMTQPHAHPIHWIHGNNKQIDKIWKNMGVYAFAIFDTTPNDLTFRFVKEIKYIGQTQAKDSFFSGRFNTVRETLNGEAIAKGRDEHAGIKRLMGINSHNLLNKLFVSIAPQPNMDSEQRKEFEQYCFAAFMCKSEGKLPECSKQ